MNGDNTDNWKHGGKLEHVGDIADRMFDATRLCAGLADMIEGGRLTKDDIPDDWEWLLERLHDAGFNPVAPEE